MIKKLDTEIIWQTAIYDAYKSTGGFISGAYLVKHSRENDDKFAHRQDIAPYDNNFRTIVDANINPVFNKVTRSLEGPDTSFSQMFLEDCTGHGINYADWMEQTGNEAHRYGYVITFFGIEEQPATADEARKIKSYPKLHKILPLQITQVEINDDGDIIGFTYKRNVYDESNVTYLTYKNGVITDGNGKVLYKLLRKPIIYSFENADKRSILPVSCHNGLLTQTIAKYDLDSLIMYQNSECTFALFRTDDASFNAENIHIGEDTIIKTKNGTTFEAFSTENVADKLRAESDAITKSMYTDYKLLTLYVGGANSSGDALSAIDNLRREELIKKSGIAYRFDDRIMQEFQELVGEVKYVYDVVYPGDFDVSSLAVYIAQAQSMINLQLAPENETMVKVDIMNKYFVNASEEQRAAFIKNEENNMEYSNILDPVDVIEDKPVVDETEVTDDEVEQ